MKKAVVLSTLTASAVLLLSACSHNNPPPGYCHQLKTAINTPRNHRPQRNTSPYFGNRSAMVQEYRQLNCEDQE